MQHLAGLRTAKPVSLEDLSRPDTFPAKAFLRELCLSHFQDLTLPGLEEVDEIEATLAGLQTLSCILG